MSDIKFGIKTGELIPIKELIKMGIKYDPNNIHCSKCPVKKEINNN